MIPTNEPQGQMASRIVLRALRRANIGAGRPVTVAEVKGAMTATERQYIAGLYVRCRFPVSVLLRRLARETLVVSAGKMGPKCTYASKRPFVMATLTRAV